jgi:acetylornithine deacetylase/succinyl-diaminopimelate desuccinylase-like protein
VNGRVLQSLILNGWKAQLAVIGADGLPNPGKAGNVMLPFTEARLSIRLPPTKNPEHAKDFIVKTLTENPPYNAKITLSNVRCGAGFNAPEFSPVLTAALSEAGKHYYGKEPLALAEGVSIPFLTFLEELWPKSQFIVTGVLGPQSNAHGPNDFLHIPYVKNLICSMAHVLAKTAGKL